MSNGTGVNGRARTTLAGQIDRLDRVLDGLAEGLNEAVAAEVQRAVGPAVREAVQAAIREVVTNRELAARLQAVTDPPPETAVATAPDASGRPCSPWGRAASWVSVLRRSPGRSLSAWAWTCASAASRARAAARAGVGRLRHAVESGRTRLRPLLLRCWPRPRATAVAGVGLGAAAYLAGHHLESAFSGGGWFTTALAAQLARPRRQRSDPGPARRDAA